MSNRVPKEALEYLTHKTLTVGFSYKDVWKWEDMNRFRELLRTNPEAAHAAAEASHAASKAAARAAAKASRAWNKAASRAATKASHPASEVAPEEAPEPHSS